MSCTACFSIVEYIIVKASLVLQGCGGYKWIAGGGHGDVWNEVWRNAVLIFARRLCPSSEKAKFSLRGSKNKARRMRIYRFLLEHFTDEQRFNITAKIGQSVLGRTRPSCRVLPQSFFLLLAQTLPSCTLALFSLHLFIFSVVHSVVVFLSPPFSSLLCYFCVVPVITLLFIQQTLLSKAMYKTAYSGHLTSNRTCQIRCDSYRIDCKAMNMYPVHKVARPSQTTMLRWLKPARGTTLPWRIQIQRSLIKSFHSLSLAYFLSTSSPVARSLSPSQWLDRSFTEAFSHSLVCSFWLKHSSFPIIPSLLSFSFWLSLNCNFSSCFIGRNCIFKCILPKHTEIN